MRLIHVTTFELESFHDDDIPPYAILSHTWGQDEFLFQHLEMPIASQNLKPTRGLAKVLKTCALALQDGLLYVWIDTCCINKESSTELSEAINSMFGWYRNASMCYVWLEDANIEDGECLMDNSNWFRRGWTLQELIAPHDVQFYDSNWDHIGSRYDLANRIAGITKIKLELLQRRHYVSGVRESPHLIHDWRCSFCYEINNVDMELSRIPVSVRMSWAASRITTRREDGAYCLLGLFDVNMPLLYGEGNKAFRRLLNEILQRSPDSSLLLWQQRRGLDTMSCLPPSLNPADFANDLPLFRNPTWAQPEIIPTPHGLSVMVCLQPCHSWRGYERMDEVAAWYLAVLSPTAGDERSAAVGIFVERQSAAYEPGPGNTERYIRVARHTTVTVRPHEDCDYAVATFCLEKVCSTAPRDGFFSKSNYLQKEVTISKSFAKVRITISNNPIIPPSRVERQPLRVAVECVRYSIRAIYPPVKNLDDQRHAQLHFMSDILASEGVIIAFATDDLSKGFFLLWRCRGLADDVVLLTPWPAVLGGRPYTPSGSKKDLKDEAWIEKLQRQFREHEGPFEGLLALQRKKQHEGPVSILTSHGVRARLVHREFVGIDQTVLIVEEMAAQG